MLAAPLTVYANDTTDTTDSSDTTDATGNQTENQPKQSIAITQSTPIVTSKSGYRVTVVISNTDSTATSSGTLHLTTNALFTFVSRTDIQNWAENNAPIPTPNELGSVDVPSIPAGGTATVTIEVNANQQTLASIGSWGPKPLMLSYNVGNQILADLPSFLTRSSDGLNTATTPAMNLTVAMPYTASGWQVDNKAISNRIAETTTSSTSTSSKSNSTDKADKSDNADASNAAKATDTQAISLSEQDADTARSLGQTFAKHRSLQVIADPLYWRQSAVQPSIAGIMQPADFDITAYTALDDTAAYEKAGITTEQWNAKQAAAWYADGGDSETPSAYAWQGNNCWTLDALTAAREQGYDTVIADASFDADQTEAVHTGTYVVHTPAGDVTVLKEQSTLGTLAKGQATSTDAQAESSDAGRLARLIAQSAFYQMEQPYTSRYLLMTFSRTTEASWIDQVMSAFEQASWLNLTDLKTMAKADPYNVSDSVNPDKADDANTANTRSALRQLADSRHDIMRMATSILRNEIDSDEVSSLDPQALARQDANDTASHSNDPTQWIGSLLALHDDMALRSMSGSPQPTATRKAMVKATKTLASDLLNGVRINPSESISVFSESAKMPITVSNDLPYAVSVQVNSLTDSMQIVTSRTADIDIPSHSDAQVTFTIRVSTSGSSTAHVSLTDREGNSFGNTQDTAITSVMRISDASGFIIIGFAVLLGIIGLWRQFHRKKDPDE
ncbi:DUF6049 family protein [Bifidobacterium longum]|uniref:DUF6049 family protein n=1 Tax=Bifidobacterium longum TaxID=216816 RepID=UPI001495CB85|nr:DUF6049 family protein [Bifidobacterium longum]